MHAEGWRGRCRSGERIPRGETPIITGREISHLRMLCSLSASLMRITSGFSKAKTMIILRICRKSSGLYSAQPWR